MTVLDDALQAMYGDSIRRMNEQAWARYSNPDLGEPWKDGVTEQAARADSVHFDEAMREGLERLRGRTRESVRDSARSQREREERGAVEAWHDPGRGRDRGFPFMSASTATLERRCREARFVGHVQHRKVM